MTQIQLRRATEADLPHFDWGGEFAEDHDLFLNVVRAQHEGLAAAVVAEVRGEFAGQLFVDLDRRAHHGWAYVWAVRVRPEMARRGVGRALMIEAERVALAQNLLGVELDVAPENLAARQFYKNLGYSRPGEDELREMLPDRDMTYETLRDWRWRKELRK